MRFNRHGDSPPVRERKTLLRQHGAAMTIGAMLATALPASGAVLLMDTYEPSPSGNDVDGSAPLADVGSYNTVHSNGRVAVYGAALTLPVGTAPAAPTGGDLQALRLQPASGGGRMAAVLSQPASASGSAVKIEFDLYASSSVGFGFGSQIQGEAGQTSGLNPSGTRPHISFSMNIASGTLSILRDGDGVPTTPNALQAAGINHATNTFQHYTIDYVLGTNQVTVTAGSQAPVAFNAPFLSATDVDFDSSNGSQPATVSSLTQVDTIFFTTGSSGAIGFLDNLKVTGEVPEPATFGAAMIGLLALRRKR
jgi:hypothetical protein